ncbi:MAG: SPFH domain-containing protein [Acidobacteriota bacterium]|nr:SPFH domain-containing protein [Acidobacteriota bacterium]
MAFIDLVSWDEPANQQNPVFAWKFRPSNGAGKNADNVTNLTTLTQLIVRESQEAVLFSKGQVLGKFGPGRHTLNTENLPLLSKFYGIPFGGKNPFFAEVWFVNKLVPLVIDWETTSRMPYQDPDYQVMVPLRAAGRYGLKVQDAERFLIKLVGTSLEFTAQELTNHFQGPLETKTKSCITAYMQSQRIGIKSISAYLEKLSAALRMPMQAFWEEYGFNLEGFYVTSVDVDGTTPEGQRILDAIARQSAQAIGGYSWQQSQAFEIANHAAQGVGNSGLLGALLVTGMMGSGAASGGLLQPVNNAAQSTGASGQVAPGAQPLVRDVFCSRCAKKYSNTSKFCPHCGDPYTPCPNCGADNDTGARRCVSCGVVLAVTQTCAHCHAPMPAEAKVCPNCGRAAGGMQNCRRCNAPISASDAFCGNCGQKVE